MYIYLDSKFSQQNWTDRDHCYTRSRLLLRCQGQTFHWTFQCPSITRDIDFYMSLHQIFWRWGFECFIHITLNFFSCRKIIQIHVWPYQFHYTPWKNDWRLVLPSCSTASFKCWLHPFSVNLWIHCSNFWMLDGSTLI